MFFFSFLFFLGFISYYFDSRKFRVQLKPKLLWITGSWNDDECNFIFDEIVEGREKDGAITWSLVGGWWIRWWLLGSDNFISSNFLSLKEKRVKLISEKS